MVDSHLSLGLAIIFDKIKEEVISINKLKMKRILIAGLLLCQYIYVYSQAYNNIHDATPPSPEVAALAKYTDIPMDYSSGVPPISIPIYTLKSGMIELPVSLNYNASGIKVEEAATWVGLGWNLSTGPTLTRIVKGLPDESLNGVMSPPVIPGTNGISYSFDYHFSLLSNDPIRSYIETVMYPNSQIDIGADVYSFNVLGFSGKFFWDPAENDFVISPKQNVKIVYSGSSILITLPNGIKCYFGSNQNEILNSNLSKNYSSVNNSWASTFEVSQQQPQTTSWIITKIEDPNGHEINFVYTYLIGATEVGRSGETLVMQQGQNNLFTAGIFIQEFKKPIIEEIIAENGTVLFELDENIREDLILKDSNNLSSVGKSLKRIKINNDNEEIKTFEFSYSYFVSTDNMPTVFYNAMPAYVDNINSAFKKRLKLNSIQELNISKGLSLPPFVFEYNTIALPNRLSTSQDFWGYFNGASNGAFLLPRLADYSINPVTLEPSDDLFKKVASFEYFNADRRISEEHAQACILTKIINPLGGSTEFYYESNEIPVTYFTQYSFIERPDGVRRSTVFMPIIPSQSPYGTLFTKNFTVINPTSWLKIDAETDDDLSYVFNIKKISDNSVVFSFSTSDLHYVRLEMGEYYIECNYIRNDIIPPDFLINLEWYESISNLNMQVGGLRVKKIVKNDGLNNILVRTFDYNLALDEGGASFQKSSGVMSGFPLHARRKKLYDINTAGYMSFVPRIMEYNSASAISLTSDGQLVRYSNVTEYVDEAHQSFRTEYQYTFDMSYIKVGDLNHLLSQNQRQWRSGQMRGKNVYELAQSEERLLSKEEVHYTVFEDTTTLEGLDPFQFEPYYYSTEWFLPTSQTSTQYVYDEQGNALTPMVSTTTIGYNDRYMEASRSNTNSKGEVVVSETWYPTDYTDTMYNLPTLVSKNIIGLPVKQITHVDNKVVSGSIIKYDVNGLPSEIYGFENETLPAPNAHNGILNFTDYVKKVEVDYNNYGDVLSIEDYRKPTSSFVWARVGERSLVVAAGKNLLPSDMAYTSFEIIGNLIGWTVYGGSVYDNNEGFTGSRCLLLTNSSVGYSGLNDTKTYRVSYWSNAGAYNVSGSNELITGREVRGWRYYEHIVSGVTSIMITGTGKIDEIRVFGEGGLMNTYVYDKVHRLRSVSDENGRMKIYEYDGLGRLKSVRDEYLNILQAADYEVNP
jgi:YD repeat-containing protein